MKLRYYAPSYDPEIDQKIRYLLKEIKSKHGIDYDVKLMSSMYDETRAYEEDFKPRARILKLRTGERITRTLKTRSGNITIKGTIAIVFDNQVQWFVSYSDPLRDFWMMEDEDLEIGFLKMVLKEGKSCLEEIISRGGEKEGKPSQIQGAIFHKFINSGVLNGEWYTEVPVGLEYTREIASKKYKEWRNWDKNKIEKILSPWCERIDALCIISSENVGVIHRRIPIEYYLNRSINFDNKEVWIIEIKPRLNHAALGQILTYKFALKQDWKVKISGMGIVCKQGNKLIEETCERLGIRVWIM